MDSQQVRSTSDNVEEGVTRTQSTITELGSFSGNSSDHSAYGHDNLLGDYNVNGNRNITFNMVMGQHATDLAGRNDGLFLSASGRRLPSRATPMRYWMVPYCRNAEFTSREAIIDLIKVHCKSGMHNRIALQGLGGCGKTQLALEYIYQHANESVNVFWVHGSDVLKFSEGFKEIAQHIGLPHLSSQDGEEGFLRSIKRWFESCDTGDWILVIDNADNEDDFARKSSPIAKFVPQGRQGTVIFTTRSQQVANRQGCKIVKVGPMAAEEALELFSQRFDGWNSLEEKERGVVTNILDWLGHLPLAVVGSAAFMAENLTQPSAYWNILAENDSQIKKLLSKDFCDIWQERDLTEGILGTYFITFDQIAKQMSHALDLLRLIAFLDRHDIPQEILTQSGLPGMDNLLDYSMAIGKLMRFSLVTEVKHDGTIFYELHRLVQLSIQVYLSEEETNKWRSAALVLVSQLFPVYSYELHHVCMAYMSHALALVTSSADPIAEDLSYRVAENFIAMGSYNQAEKQAQSCLELRRVRVDSDRQWMGYAHSRTSLLATVRRYQGRAKEAVDMYRQILSDVEMSLPENDPSIFSALSSLGAGLYSLGEYKESQVIHQRALDGCEKVLGPNHPDTLTSRNNLAQVLHKLGRNEESEVILRDVLAIREKDLGPGHPDTLAPLNNLALVLYTLEKNQESVEMIRRVSERCEDALGPGHPDTLSSLSNLAIALKTLERYEESEELNRRALTGREIALGRDHPDTLASISNLALVLKKLGRYSESEEMNRRALAGREIALGRDHPDTLSSLHNLAMLLYALGRYEETEEINRRVLEAREKALEPDHPDILMSLHRLALTLRKLGRYDESEVVNRRALMGFEKTLRPGHPHILACLRDLAAVLRGQGKSEESEVMNRRALKGSQEII